MRILGVDCGSRATGYGVIESDGRVHSLVASGVIRFSNGASLAARLAHIHERLAAIVAEHRPEAVAIEEVFHAANVNTALKLAHVRGVALLVAAQAGLPVGEYSPLEVKTSVVGYGRAEKHQVQTMIASLLALPETASEDASDALAVAICHATAGRR
jgi:crossover junction endodeoxyribonuclease RuvC